MLIARFEAERVELRDFSLSKIIFFQLTLVNGQRLKCPAAHIVFFQDDSLS